MKMKFDWLKEDNIDKKIMIDNMLHTLGIEYTNHTKVLPNKRYSPYPTSHRNHFQISECEEWNRLVELGYATFQINGLNLPYYRITDSGKVFLKDIGYKWHE